VDLFVPTDLSCGAALMKQDPASKRLLSTAGALLGLLALTVGAACVDLGPFNTIAAISISVTKTALVVVFFMEIRGRGPVIWVSLATGFFFLGIMFALAMSDFLTRGWK
jgi:cytochrome c oxidase subunit IV